MFHSIPLSNRPRLAQERRGRVKRTNGNTAVGRFKRVFSKQELKPIGQRGEILSA